MELIPQRKGPVIIFIAGFVVFLLTALVAFVVAMLKR